MAVTGPSTSAAPVMPPIHSDRPGAQATQPSVAEASGPAITRAVEEHAMRFIPAVVAGALNAGHPGLSIA